MKIGYKFVVVLLMLCSITATRAQDKNHYKKLYKQSLSYADVATAASALNNLIVLGETTYKDSLATLYNRGGLFNQSYSITKQLLADKPANKLLLELMVDNTTQLGIDTEALAYVDKLLVLDKANSYYLYRKSLLLINTKDYSGCLQTINTVLETAINPTEQITVEGLSKPQVAIPIHAALYNLKGLVYYQLKDVSGAHMSFTKALELAPEFKLAKTNLDALQKLKTKQDEK